MRVPEYCVGCRHRTYFNDIVYFRLEYSFVDLFSVSLGCLFFVKPARRLRESFVEVSFTEGSTKAPWRVHEASSKGTWRNFARSLYDDTVNSK